MAIIKWTMRRHSVAVIFLLCLMGLCGLPRGDAWSEEVQKARYLWLLTSPDRVLLSGAGENFLLRLTGELPESDEGAPAVGPAVAVEPFLGPDIKLNDADPAGTDRTTQSEVSIAVFGSGPTAKVVAGWNDSRVGKGFSGVGFSDDGGATWTDGSPLPPPPGGSTGGDPSIGVDKTGAFAGRFYYATLAEDSGGVSIIGVSRSEDGGATWTTPVTASMGVDPTSFNDKELLTVGPEGNVYVSWTEFRAGGGTRLRFSRSTDGGVTFSPAIFVQKKGRLQGSMPATAPDGRVYVAWEHFRKKPQIRVARSDDLGLTFPKANKRKVATIVPIGFSKLCPSSGFRRVLSTGTGKDIRVNDFPAIAVGGDGTVYVVWNDGRFDESDVLLSFSTDLGATWSDPNVVNPTTEGAQFFPNIVVDGDGVHVMYYSLDFSTGLITVKVATSTDGGLTFTETTVSDVGFPVVQTNPNFDPVIHDCYMGDYNGIASDGGTRYVGWGDNRNILVTPGFPGGRNDPDIRFDTVP